MHQNHPLSFDTDIFASGMASKHDLISRKHFLTVTVLVSLVLRRYVPEESYKL